MGLRIMSFSPVPQICVVAVIVVRLSTIYRKITKGHCPKVTKIAGYYRRMLVTIVRDCGGYLTSQSAARTESSIRFSTPALRISFVM